MGTRVVYSQENSTGNHNSILLTIYIKSSWSVLWLLYTYPNVYAVIVTTHWNGTCSMLTSAKLTEGYLVVGITRELNKEPLLHCSSIYINTRWSMLQQYVYLMSYYSSTIYLPQDYHAMSMCPDIILFNLCHHVCTMCTPWGTIVPWCHP